MRTRDTDKEDIVRQKAIEMLVEHGIEGFGMNRLSKECGISVATLYIYYANKEDLINKIGIDIGKKFFGEMMKDFSSEMNFVDGLRLQWHNRAHFMMNNLQEVTCWEVLQNSSYSEAIINASIKDFRKSMMLFFQKALANKEITPVSKDVFWSIAYGPLYSLLRFHEKRKSIGGTPFKLTQAIQNETFQLVIKALKP
ncbi:MAG: TetR/AcrR family transcriptional regulator [Saprospiraceae bacterium]